MAQAVIRARTDLDASGFQKGISAMQAGAMKLKGFVAGAFSVGAIAALAKGTISAGGDIADMADNLRVTTDELQALEFGFRNAGAEAGQVVSLLERIKSTSATAAMEGDASSAAKAYAALGISLEEISDLTSAEKLERIAKAYNDSGKSAAVYASVLDILGKQGNKTENALVALGEQGVGGFLMDALNAGTVASEAAVRAADKADDKLNNLIAAAKRAAIEVAGVGADDPEPKPEGRKQSEIDAEVRAENKKRENEKEAAKLREETAQKLEKHNAKMMSDSERMVFLIGEMRRLDALTAAYFGDDLELAKIESQIADAKIELEDMKRQAESEKPEVEAMRYDELRRIGGNLAGAQSRDPREELKKARKTADEQLAVLQEINRKVGQGASL